MRWRGWAGASLGLACLVAGVVWIASAADRDVETGRQLFVTNCATCHGDSGKGDGASAVGFATKPFDLTEGRLLNALPDEFLVGVVTDGGGCSRRRGSTTPNGWWRY